MQSTRQYQERKPLHVAIIMDGNGRWATARGLPREAGHRAGLTALRRVVESAPSLSITTLTVFAFSTENWNRPPREVDALMTLLRRYLRREIERLAEAGVRVTAIGRRDRFPVGISDLLARAESATALGTTLDLRLAFDYSARDAILDAVSAAGATPLTREVISHHLALRSGGPDVDLVIRTSGEQRLSDFMLWEAAYAELYFTPVLWPDFGRPALEQAMAAFCARERRFGGLAQEGPEKPAAPHKRGLLPV
jgi:undecaprenyl diphosphate synthase